MCRCEALEALDKTGLVFVAGMLCFNRGCVFEDV